MADSPMLNCVRPNWFLSRVSDAANTLYEARADLLRVPAARAVGADSPAVVTRFCPRFPRSARPDAYLSGCVQPDRCCLRRPAAPIGFDTSSPIGSPVVATRDKDWFLAQARPLMTVAHFAAGGEGVPN
jgi:hypothetical protein